MLTGIVFIDLCKAFDSVDHGLLLRKLHCFGSMNEDLKYFENYLSDRTQYVRYQNVCIIWGSSVLSVNDLPNVLTQCSMHRVRNEDGGKAVG